MSNNFLGKKHYLEVDVLKALAILLIILCHLHFFVFNTYKPLLYFSYYISYFGLALFLFLSGFTLYNSNPDIRNIKDTINFYKKRIIRIMPLYWLGLILFMLLSLFTTFTLIFKQFSFSLIHFIIYIFGFQTFFGDYIPAMWFIGVILIYYILYPIIIFFSNKKSLVICGLLLIFLIVLWYPLNIIKISDAALYFPVFISGIFANKFNLFYNYKHNKLFIYAFIMFITSLFLDMYMFFIVLNGDMSSILLLKGVVKICMFILTFLARNVFMISLCLISFWLVKQLLPRLNKETINVFSFITCGSYATYLIHLQFFGTIIILLDAMNIADIYIRLVLILVSIPILLIIGYLIQKYADNLPNRIEYTFRI